MIELFWIGMTIVSAAVALLNGALESHPIDVAVTSPLLPLLGVVGAYLVMQTYSPSALTVWLIIRFVMAGLIGLGLVAAVLIQFSPHLGPGGLGAVALHLIYWTVGAVATGGCAVVFLLRVLRR